MRLLTALSLALLPTLCLAGLSANQKPAPTVEEPQTEVQFPLTLTLADQQSQHQIAGVGVRIKRKFFMDFKVYAMGFYLDEMVGLPLLGESAGDLSAKELRASEGFRAVLLSDKFGKTMRLVMVRDVDADDMASAFEDALWPRMKARCPKGKQRTAAKAALDSFRACFKDEAEEGQVLDFTWLPGGKLHTTIDGKASPVTNNAALCWALFDVYLGDDPISEDAKANFVSALHAKLHP